MRLQFAILILCTNLAISQVDSTYKFSGHIARDIQRDTTPWRYQMGATHYANSSFYREALKNWDLAMPGKPRIGKKDSLGFLKLRQVDAAKYIVEQAANEKIVIINEAHHNARHRAFSRSLLAGLYNQGFRFLGLEALADSLINTRRFPVQQSGFYTREPEMGNLITQAIRLGFTVFGYEASQGINGKQREIDQAKNIAKLLLDNPGAKIFIHCGYDHVIEGAPNNPSWEKAMAGRLKDFTGIDPFTVDQVAFSERGHTVNEHPYVRLSGPGGAKAVILEDGKIFSRNPDQTDVSIIHPTSKDHDSRPQWLTDGKKKYTLPVGEFKVFPLLVLAYREGEFEKSGVPADIVEIRDQSAKSGLHLLPGKYTLIVRAQNYDIHKKFNISVK